MRRLIKIAALAALTISLAGCSTPPDSSGKTPEKIQAETQTEIAANNASLLTDPIAIKCRTYSGPAYDDERQSLAQHLKMNPLVVKAAMDPASGEYDPGMDVLLQRGVSDSETRALAHRIRVYLSTHYGGDRALIVRSINLHHQASENAEAEAFSQKTGDSLGVVGAIVQNGVEDTDTQIDPLWHVEIDHKQVE